MFIPSITSSRRQKIVALCAAAGFAVSLGCAFAQVRQGDAAVSEIKTLPGLYLVRLRSPSLATELARQGAVDRAAMHSAQAQVYVARLDREQDGFLRAASARAGRPLEAIGESFRFRRAINGLAVRLSAAEATALRKQPEVQSVEPVKLLPLDTDVGPQLVEAPKVWGHRYRELPRSGLIVPAPIADRASPPHSQGEGTVIGAIDSGLNFGSPSFAARDGARFRHRNPLGTGNFLGLCGPDAIEEWTPRCNDKVIGAYDFIDALMPEIQLDDPAANDGPVGPEDNDGHGSHTASTAGGNVRIAQVAGGPRRLISGVAPRANLVVFDACYVSGDGSGLCPEVSLLAAVEQAIADGVVDVINYSISGGEEPWNDAISLAFLDAVESGITVAASAGNSGPSPNTLGHVEPWTISAAAQTHTRGAFVNKLRLTAPQPVPSELTDLPIVIASSGTQLSGQIAAPLSFDAASPLLCTPPAEGAFAGNIVMIRRGTCTFLQKVTNAQTGGAIAVVLVNTDDSALNPAVDGTTIPVGALLKSQGDAIEAFFIVNAGVAALLDFPSEPTEEEPDVLAAFSSRGPNAFAVAKPDVSAPGVNVLAAVAGAPEAVGLLSGTSMASPHVAGAAALLKSRRPDWTPAEIKSALVLTATSAVFDEADGEPATILERGAGRIRIGLAAEPGLLMHVSGEDYRRADPALGGDPAQLNTPNLASLSCVGGCNFVRTVHSIERTHTTWTASVSGLPGKVTPASFSLRKGQSQALVIHLDTTAAPQDAHAFAEVVLTPQRHSRLPVLRMPAAVFVGTPAAQQP